MIEQILTKPELENPSKRTKFHAPVNTSLDEKFIQSLHKAYFDFKCEIYALNQQQSSQFTSQMMKTNFDCDTEIVVDMFRVYATSFIKLVESIPGKYD